LRCWQYCLVSKGLRGSLKHVRVQLAVSHHVIIPASPTHFILHSLQPMLLTLQQRYNTEKIVLKKDQEFGLDRFQTFTTKYMGVLTLLQFANG